MADIDRKRLPFTLTMDELERICLTYKLMCDRDPKIKNFISPEIQPLLLENQTFEHLKFRDESGDEIPQVVFREENKDNFFPF